MRRAFSALLTAVSIAVGVVSVAAPAVAAASCTRTSQTIVIPLTAAHNGGLIRHAQDAINRGYPVVMILHRAGAGERRDAALAHIPAKPGYDRDEYPAAIGRAVVRTDVRYVPNADNRSGGTIMGNRLVGFCDGTRFTYAGTKAHHSGTTPRPGTPAPAKNDPRFATCAAAKKAGYGPYRRGIDPEYGWYQDRDMDGVVCE
jgi:hypothetical protein